MPLPPPETIDGSEKTSYGEGMAKRKRDRKALKSLTSADGTPTTVIHLMNLEITWNPIPEPELKKLPSAVQDRMAELYAKVITGSATILPELRELTERYPKVLCLRNWMISALRGGSPPQRSEAFCLSEELVRERPDYLFARTTHAELLLDEHRTEEAAKLFFSEDTTLPRLYPDRKTYHILEIRHWAFVCGKIKVIQGEPDGARSYLDLLDSLEEESEASRELRRLITNNNLNMLAKLASGFKKLTSGKSRRRQEG